MTEPGLDQPPAMMSIDVEDWFHVENLSPAIGRETWSERQLRVERNMDRMLELMADAPGGRVRASCFVLGWVAERCPALIRRIAAAGHEIASHGHAHELVGSLSPERFARTSSDPRRCSRTSSVRRCAATAPPASRSPSGRFPCSRSPGSGTTRPSSPRSRTTATDGCRELRPDEPIVELAPGFHEVRVSCLTVGLARPPLGRRRVLPPDAVPRSSGAACATSSAGRGHTSSTSTRGRSIPTSPASAACPASYRFRHYVGLESLRAALRVAAALTSAGLRSPTSSTGEIQRRRAS